SEVVSAPRMLETLSVSAMGLAQRPSTRRGRVNPANLRGGS
ncbi:hypothetical protein, partial [Pseudomonas phage vB_Pae_BR213a]